MSTTEPRLLIAAELRQLVTERVGQFPALEYVWQTLATPGKVLGPEDGFTWGELCLLVTRAAGGSLDTALPLAAATECFITALDVLDDVQDDDSPDALYRSCGVATATNVATLLLFLWQCAISRLAAVGVTADRVAAISRVLADAGAQACGGQQSDIDQISHPKMDEERYLATIAQKSASLVRGICQAAAMLGSTSDPHVERFAQCGFNLGMALQVGNDIAALSRDSGRRCDLLDGKHTLPIMFATDCSSPAIRQELVKRVGAGRQEGRVENSDRIKEILDSTGALHYATAVADVFWERALACLDELGGASDLRCSISQWRGDTTRLAA